MEQREDTLEIPHIKKLIAEGRGPQFSIDEQGVVRYKDRLVVPSNEELRRKILNEAHHSKLSIHPESNKMYHDLRQLYWVVQHEAGNHQVRHGVRHLWES